MHVYLCLYVYVCVDVYVFNILYEKRFVLLSMGDNCYIYGILQIYIAGHCISVHAP